MLIEVTGYLASFTIMASLLMGNVARLRIINMVGCILFTIYGLSIGALPVALLNGVCVFINLYHLAKLKREKQQILTPVEA